MESTALKTWGVECDGNWIPKLAGTCRRTNPEGKHSKTSGINNQPQTHAEVCWEQARDGQKVWAAMGCSVQCSSAQVQQGTEIRDLEGNHCREWPRTFGAHHPAQGWAPMPGACSVQQFWTCFMSYSVIFARSVASETGVGARLEALFASVISF